jgi:hypothetical protein
MLFIRVNFFNLSILRQTRFLNRYELNFQIKKNLKHPIKEISLRSRTEIQKVCQKWDLNPRPLTRTRTPISSSREAFA